MTESSSLKCWCGLGSFSSPGELISQMTSCNTLSLAVASANSIHFCLDPGIWLTTQSTWIWTSFSVLLLPVWCRLALLRPSATYSSLPGVKQNVRWYFCKRKRRPWKCGGASPRAFIEITIRGLWSVTSLPYMYSWNFSQLSLFLQYLYVISLYCCHCAWCVCYGKPLSSVFLE